MSEGNGNGRVETTVRLDREMYEELRQAAFDLRITHNQVLTEALEMWLRRHRRKFEKV